MSRMRAEYDFTKGIRGKYARRYACEAAPGNAESEWNKTEPATGLIESMSDEILPSGAEALSNHGLYGTAEAVP
jgi:hypothetical protein